MTDTKHDDRSFPGGGSRGEGRGARGEARLLAMAAVINLLRFKEPVDPGLFAQAARDLTPQMRAIEGFQDFYAIQTSDTEVALLIFGDDVDTLNRVATEVGSPWMAAHVVPLLAAPPDRLIGPTVASSRPAEKWPVRAPGGQPR